MRSLSLPSKVTVVEVGPRDGLQNEARTIGTAEKIEFVNRLSAARLPVIEASATTGNDARLPSGVIVPRTNPVTSYAASAEGIDRRFTPSSARSFGQAISRSPGTSTKRWSPSATRTTIVLTTWWAVSPRAAAASASDPTGPCRVTT